MIGRFFCWLGRHLPTKSNPRGRGIWICTRRGCNQLVTGRWP